MHLGFTEITTKFNDVPIEPFFGYRYSYLSYLAFFALPGTLPRLMHLRGWITLSIYDNKKKLEEFNLYLSFEVPFKPLN